MMSDSVLGGIIGALLAGAFLIGAQLLASRSQDDVSRKALDAQAAIARETFQAQAEQAREASKAQADMAREAWTRGHEDAQHALLDTACLDVIRYIQQIGTAVENWENGNMQPAQGLATINSAAQAVLEAGYGIFLRRGMGDPTGPLIAQVVNQASVFTGLYNANRIPPATAAEKKAQVAVVGAASTEVFNAMHNMLREDARGN